MIGPKRRFREYVLVGIDDIVSGIEENLDVVDSDIRDACSQMDSMAVNFYERGSAFLRAAGLDGWASLELRETQFSDSVPFGHRCLVWKVDYGCRAGSRPDPGQMMDLRNLLNDFRQEEQMLGCAMSVIADRQDRLYDELLGWTYVESGCFQFRDHEDALVYVVRDGAAWRSVVHKRTGDHSPLEPCDVPYYRQMKREYKRSGMNVYRADHLSSRPDAGMIADHVSGCLCSDFRRSRGIPPRDTVVVVAVPVVGGHHYEEVPDPGKVLDELEEYRRDGGLLN